MKAQCLPAYLWEAAAAPFSWREQYDCAYGFVGGWVALVTGKDARAPWAGRYRTELGCARLLRREGGLVAVMDRGLGAIGVARTNEPAIGDIGVVEAQTARGQSVVAAIRSATGWAALTGAGLVVMEAPHLAAWGL